MVDEKEEELKHCPFHPEIDSRLDRIETTTTDVFKIVTRLEHFEGPIGKLNERMKVQERVVERLHERQDGFDGRLGRVEHESGKHRKTVDESKRVSLIGGISGGLGGLIVILLLVMRILGYLN